MVVNQNVVARLDNWNRRSVIVEDNDCIDDSNRCVCASVRGADNNNDDG